MTEIPPFAYCDSCKQIRAVEPDPHEGPDVSGEYLGADLVCRECFSILVTLYRKALTATDQRR